jgi:very-short-patch-repair endonuclease
MLLASMLGWEMELAVKTGHSTSSRTGYPPCYKLDIGCLTLRVGVEVDGQSHRTLERMQQDQKKDEMLRSLGWTVLRFSNEEVMEDPAKVVQTVLSTISKLPNTTTTSLKAS